MLYKRLNYQQYFIDTSEDYHKTGKVYLPVEYQAVRYQCHKWEEVFGLFHEVNYAFVYDEKRDVIQIHFQKTNGKSDWFANIAEFASKYYDSFSFEGEMIELSVHRGWARMYKTIKREVREQWCELHTQHPKAYTEIIGWSLGSGQAMLCCQDLNWNFGVRPYLYTFGSVKPFYAKKGSRELLERYLSSISSGCFNFAIHNDLVTYMPPFKGFSMINRRNIGREKRNLLKLLNPYRYHTIYGEEYLYQKEESQYR